MNSDFFASLSKATKVLLVINLVFFALAAFLPELNRHLALYYFESPLFRPYQIATHVFMHAGIAHLLFNMYALVLFGSVVEKHIGTSSFLIVYFISAFGAFGLHMAVVAWQLTEVPGDILAQMQSEGAEILLSGRNYVDPVLAAANLKLNTAVVGASGAIMGVLAAFAYYFPNARLSLIFLPVPIKAMYFVPLYMLLELFLGVKNFQWDNVAHFAHIGGALFGFLAILLIGKRRPGL